MIPVARKNIRNLQRLLGDCNRYARGIKATRLTGNIRLTKNGDPQMTKLICGAIALAFSFPSSLAASAGESSLALAESRMIPMEGGRNFRDVGGYRTADGRTVRWNVLYRSGSLGNLQKDGMARLRTMNIRAIIDLRMTTERKSDQSNWLSIAGLGYFTRDYMLGGDEASLAQMFSDPSKLTASTMRAMMIQGYRTMPKELAPQYRELFARLIAPGKGAIVVNCTAGKDRTGIATALVLTAIGVPYETVREDFLLSNDGLNMDSVRDAISPQLALLPSDVIQPLVGVEGEYLDAAFAQMKADYGSIEAYLEKEIGVGPAEIASLKSRVLK
jgi:protein-tyrosine phosphatase